jgi:hypothetical protein
MVAVAMITAVAVTAPSALALALAPEVAVETGTGQTSADNVASKDSCIGRADKGWSTQKSRLQRRWYD